MDNLKLVLNLKDGIQNLKVGSLITKYVKKAERLYFKFEAENGTDYVINKQFISEIDQSKVKIYVTSKTPKNDIKKLDLNFYEHVMLHDEPLEVLYKDDIKDDCKFLADES